MRTIAAIVSFRASSLFAQQADPGRQRYFSSWAAATRCRRVARPAAANAARPPPPPQLPVRAQLNPPASASTAAASFLPRRRSLEQQKAEEDGRAACRRLPSGGGGRPRRHAGGRNMPNPIADLSRFNTAGELSEAASLPVRSADASARSGLRQQLIQIDIDLARRADVADFEAVGLEAVLDQPGLLDRDPSCACRDDEAGRRCPDVPRMAEGVIRRWCT